MDAKLYDFYYSQKQADYYSDVNLYGGDISYSPWDGFYYRTVKVNRIFGQPYTACCKHNTDHGCAWDDMVFLCTAEMKFMSYGPDLW